MISIPQPLSNLQLELLKVFSTNLSEADLIELRELLANFYAQKSIELANKSWREQALSDETIIQYKHCYKEY